MTTSVSKTRTLVECALMIAVGTVLAQIPLFRMPNGGAMTLLSMLPFILVSYRHGLAWGLLTGFANSLLQMLTGFYPPPAGTVIAFIGVIMLDYVLAFTVLGTACVFAKPFKNRLVGVVVGAFVVCFLRYLCSWISGAWLWASQPLDWGVGMNVWLYSLIYNGIYMLPEAVLTSVGAGLLYKVAPKLFKV